MHRINYLKGFMYNGFTLIELLIVVAIIGILAAVGIVSYNRYISYAKCSAYKDQHQTVVSLVQTTLYACDSNGWTYMNLPPGLTCRSSPKAGMEKISGDGYTTKCVRKWDCNSIWSSFNIPPNAGIMDGPLMDHVRAELSHNNNTSSFIRNDQIHNFENPKNQNNTLGLTNIRGVPPYGQLNQPLRISTNIGNDCDSNIFATSNIAWSK